MSSWNILSFLSEAKNLIKTKCFRAGWRESTCRLDRPDHAHLTPLRVGGRGSPQIRLIFIANGYFSGIMNALTKQELHRLAMNVVGKHLERSGFEFMGINSELKKDPQFVCLKDKKLHFIVVKAVLYPDHPGKYDATLMEKVKEHALKFKAKTYYAGVGLANAGDYERPVMRNEDYIINYEGLVEV